MSRSCRIAITASALPPRSALQAAIKALGYPLSLDDDVDPREHSRYLACILDGEDAGFTLAPDAAGITLRWSGDPREQCAALIFAVAVAGTSRLAIHDAAGAALAEDELKQRIRSLLAEQ